MFDSGRAPWPACPSLKLYREQSSTWPRQATQVCSVLLFRTKFNSRASPVLEVRRTWPNIPGQGDQIFSQAEQCPGDTDFISLMATHMHRIEVSTSLQAIIHRVSGPTPTLTTLPAREQQAGRHPIVWAICHILPPLWLLLLHLACIHMEDL